MVSSTRAVNKYREEYDVYIGRGSKWGNPFSHKQGTKAEYVVPTRDEAVSRFEEYLLSRPDLLADLDEIRGKRLGCFCKPAACHGDVLARYADGQ